MPQEPQKIIQMIGMHFRVQPILCAQTHKIHAVEILSKRKLNFNDETAMLRQDISTLHAASILSKILGKKIHCNAEIKSIVSQEWLDVVLRVNLKNLVIEVVERNSDLENNFVLKRAADVMRIIKNSGGEIALDDVSATETDKKAIEFFAPDIIKVESYEFLKHITNKKGVKIVVERIETIDAIRKIPYTDFLQGYWCDVFAARHFPSELELPGVVLRNIKS